MPRKGPVPKRQLAVDPVFNSPIVTQLINKVLLDGKKTVAEGIVYGALEGASEKNGQDAVVTLIYRCRLWKRRYRRGPWIRQ